MYIYMYTTHIYILKIKLLMSSVEDK